LPGSGKAPLDVSGATMSVQHLSLLNVTRNMYSISEAELQLGRAMELTKSLIAIRRKWWLINQELRGVA
jgi:hypothetical protein